MKRKLSANEAVLYVNRMSHDVNLHETEHREIVELFTSATFDVPRRIEPVVARDNHGAWPAITVRIAGNEQWYTGRSSVEKTLRNLGGLTLAELDAAP